MVYDCFQFFNELDILKLRMHVLDDVVDKFVISEATVTFSGEKKPLYFQENREMFRELGIEHGQRAEITISNGTRTLYKNIVVYAKSFADVYVGDALLYVNSLDNMALAINQGSFAKAYSIGTGITWKLSIRKAPKIVYD